MSLSEEGRRFRKDAPDSLYLVCPRCGVDSDTEDFEIFNPAFVPHADYVLIEGKCLTCGMTADLALWLINKQEFLEGQSADYLTADSVSILDRYLTMVEESRREWENVYDREPALHEKDLSQEHIELSSTRFRAISAQLLAAARGLRKVVFDHPGCPPIGILRLGHFNCALSLDETPSAVWPYALHLSVGNICAPGKFSGIEQAFLASLFFTPGEVGSLRAEPGQTQPLIHFYSGADSLELNQC